MPDDRSSPVRSLWFWVVLAFLVLIGAWAAMITIAVKNAPEKIETEARDR